MPGSARSLTEGEGVTLGLETVSRARKAYLRFASSSSRLFTRSEEERKNYLDVTVTEIFLPEMIPFPPQASQWQKGRLDISSLHIYPGVTAFQGLQDAPRSVTCSIETL